MTELLKALETRYRGFRFRSRAEARWAVFFDAIGVKWDYEKDGYDLGEEGPYLPDFWLLESQVHAEVKGQEFTVREVNLCRILALRSSYPVVMLAGSPEARIYLKELPNGLLGTHEWATDTNTLTLAADRARTARFEHGESPSQEKIVLLSSHPAARTSHSGRGDSAERELIRAILLNRSRLEQIAEKLGAESLREPYRAIYRALIATGSEGTTEELIASLKADAIETVKDLLAEGAIQMDPERTISDGLAILRARDLDQRAAEIDHLIPLAQQPEKDKLIGEKDEIRKELKATGRNYFKKFRRPR